MSDPSAQRNNQPYERGEEEMGTKRKTRDGGGDHISTAPARGCNGDVKQRRFLSAALTVDLEGLTGVALA